VLYACAFFIAGAILIALTYFYLVQAMDNRPGSDAQALVQRFAGERGIHNTPILDRLFNAIAEQAEQERHDTLQTMLVWSLASLVAVGVAACGFGWLLAGRVLQPLADVTATARRVAGSNLHERISLSGPDDEIKKLADTFDAMLERLDRAFDGQNRFVANASHELRTPLAINRTLIEVALEDPAVPESTRQLGDTLLAVNLRQERLIDGLLVLASSEQHLDVRSPVDLADVARRAVVGADSESKTAGVEITSELSAAMVIDGDRYGECEGTTRCSGDHGCSPSGRVFGRR
jgi:signal transduction histidine kinase